MSEYRVQFEVFEGPLDLLLYLVRKEEVDIYEVNLTKIATQFIEHIEIMRQLDLEVAGEFLVMASTLMFIKSRELLPVEQQAATDGEEEGEDPRWELIRQLVEYKKFKDAAAQLQAREVQQEDIYPRVPAPIQFEALAGPAKPQVSLFDLVGAVSSILKRFHKDNESRDVFEDKWTVSEKIEMIRQALSTSRRSCFSALFEASTSRTEVVVTFLAMLELIRLKVLHAAQEDVFGEIQIEYIEDRPPEPGEAGPEAAPAPESPAVPPPAIAPS
jgi:segregation and condensation protein A